MLLLNMRYTKSAEAVAPHFPAHAAWVKKYVDEGIFLLAGPKKNKSGGVLIAHSLDQTTLDKILAEDSYVKENVCDYEVIEFDCKVAIPAIGLLTEGNKA